MADFRKTIVAHTGTELTEDEQKNAGQPIAGSMAAKEEDFMKSLVALIDAGKIDPYDQNTFLVQEVYEKLDPAWREKTDIALVNIAQQIRLIYEFYKSRKTPDACPQLETMVDQLWIMKQRIEEHHNVFKF